MRKLVYFTCIPCILLLLHGCYDDLDLLQSDPLDKELEAVLDALNPGRGKEAFKLPDPSDFDAIPQDINNPLSEEKVLLGQMLFHETSLGLKPKLVEGTRTYSCASCHHSGAGFQAGIRQGIGEGGKGFGMAGELRVPDPGYHLDSLDKQPIKSPSALNVAYQRATTWNGKFGAMGPNTGTAARWTTGTPLATNFLGYEGPEIQAIAGLGVHRMTLDTSQIFPTDTLWRYLFDQAFRFFTPSKRYNNETAGLAIAAYERTLLPTQAPFQDWIRGGTDGMGPEEKRGAMLFFGKAKCASCHNDPALGSNEFYALGMDDLSGEGSYGTDPSDMENLGRGGFTGVAEDEYKFKVPQLYNLADARFFGHGSSFSSLREVVEYKNKGVASNANVPLGQLAEGFKPLGLTSKEIDQITIFLTKSLRDPNLSRFNPVTLPSGLCSPNNDESSKIDLGCN